MEPEQFAMPILPRITAKQRLINDYHVLLTDDIGAPQEYIEELALFRTATPDDFIELEVCSDGGRLDTCNMLRNAIMQCEAQVVGKIGMLCASAAGAIILACPNWVVDETSAIHIHTASLGSSRQKTRDLVKYAGFNEKQVDTFVRTTYTGFLSEDEIERVLDGEEMYFIGEDLLQRLQNLGEYRASLMEEDIPLDVMLDGEPDTSKKTIH